MRLLFHRYSIIVFKGIPLYDNFGEMSSHTGWSKQAEVIHRNCFHSFTHSLRLCVPLVRNSAVHAKYTYVLPHESRFVLLMPDCSIALPHSFIFLFLITLFSNMITFHVKPISTKKINFQNFPK